MSRHAFARQSSRPAPISPFHQSGADILADGGCTFHDLRHSFATMMIAGGCDVRTVASYLGHASVSMTPDIYADVDPEAKRAAVDKVADSFDVDLDSLYDLPKYVAAPSAGVGALTFSVDQLKAMLAAAEEKEAVHGTGVAARCPRRKHLAGSGRNGSLPLEPTRRCRPHTRLVAHRLQYRRALGGAQQHQAGQVQARHHRAHEPRPRRNVRAVAQGVHLRRARHRRRRPPCRRGGDGWYSRTRGCSPPRRRSTR
ncbi:MAG: tyrosine-type recombinase/integrase [Olsenella profusa]